MDFVIIIPARMNSTRLPRKPLLQIKGKSLIRRVYEEALKTKASRICIATDHESIVRECESFKAEVVLTSPDHKSGTDRLSEAASILNLEEKEIVVNLQGDEPFINPRDIDSLVYLLIKEKKADLVTLYSELLENEHDDVDKVKIWIKSNKKVMGFSRRKNLFRDTGLILGKHIGIYAYRVSFLKEFVTLKESSQEKKALLQLHR